MRAAGFRETKRVRLPGPANLMIANKVSVGISIHAA
jgi:hypothetical protein